METNNTYSDRIRTAVNVLSDGYVSGIVAHLSKDELEKYDREHGGIHPELAPALGHDSQGKSTWLRGEPNLPFISISISSSIQISKISV